MTIDELLSYIFDDQPNILAGQFAEWLLSSTRFRAFAVMYRDKIRKKIRGVRDTEGRRDLVLEFEAAYLLLQERSFSVAYEKYGTGKARGPDFTVTFKTRTLFNVEVTRMRAPDVEKRSPMPDQAAATEDTSGKQHEIGKLADTVCGKLGQMLAGMINVLLIAPDETMIDAGDLAQALRLLKERAERKDADFFSRYGFRSAPDFFKYYQRLSGVLVRSAHADRSVRRAILWTNAQARQPLPADIRAILQR